MGATNLRILKNILQWQPVIRASWRYQKKSKIFCTTIVNVKLNTYLCIGQKEIRIMTQAELNFYEGVPRTLREIAAQLKALNDNIKKLTEKVENLED